MPTLLILVVHAGVGFGCLSIFWLTVKGADATRDWFPVYAVALGCALIAFGLSYFTSRTMAGTGRRVLRAGMFSLGFIVVSLVCFPGVFDGKGMWRPLAFWAPIGPAGEV